MRRGRVRYRVRQSSQPGAGAAAAEERRTADHPVGLPPPVTQPAEASPVAPAQQPGPGSAESIVLAAGYTSLVESTKHAPPAWPVWRGTGKPVDGIACLDLVRYHLHSLVSIYHDGKRLGLPGGIGSANTGCAQPYELHVHDVTGIIHMESDVPGTFKLGQRFSLWQQPLSRDSIAGLAGPVRYYIIEDEKNHPL